VTETCKKSFSNNSPEFTIEHWSNSEKLADLLKTHQVVDI